MTDNSVVDAYTNPKNPGSFSGIKKFLDNNKFNDIQEVKETLQNLRSYTLHSGKKPSKKRRVVVTSFLREIVAIDLLDITDLHRFNSFYKWMLVLVDTFSRFVWVYKLKNKTAQAVSITLNQHFSDPKNICKKLWGDRDKSF
jgi:hypothetical protein